MRFDLYKQDNNKYCRFHIDHRHDTEKYFELKKEIKNLLR